MAQYSVRKTDAQMPTSSAWPKRSVVVSERICRNNGQVQLNGGIDVIEAIIVNLPCEM